MGLDRMRGHTEVMVQYVADNEAIRLRFEQHFQQYADFWQTLEMQCQSHHEQLHACSSEMWDVIQLVEAEVDKRDSQQSMAMSCCQAAFEDESHVNRDRRRVACQT